MCPFLGSPSLSPSTKHAPAAGLSGINNFAVADLVEDSTAIGTPPIPILPVASAFEGPISPPVLVKPPPSIAVIAASVTIGVAFLMVVAVALWFIPRHRRALRAQQSSSAQLVLELGQEDWTKFDSRRSGAGSESSIITRASWAPYINKLKTRQPLSPSNTVSTRQLYISNQVNRARQKVAELEAETSTLLRSSSNASRQESILTEADELTVHDPNSAIYERLERAIGQIEGLNDRIRELEHQRRSSWALGLSDEPPPGYIE
ncbi:hypothetical protein C8F04DRAFT_1343687 [Mycena alexandri]|uniref:Uncharacterized protein n=1 Tax=Mycena alexandri TaxID=1745969 RepID=A0AAD6XAE5_9AGAR|nr:hypothetical protein C8F04DRAFT_1343687 [Mycena alexandri]